MIAFNKNIKDGSMIVSDWDVIQTGYLYYYTSRYFYEWGTINNGTQGGIINGGQEGWTFASLTDAEVELMKTSNVNIALPAGSFPFLNKILVPTITQDVSGNYTLKFSKTSICSNGAEGDRAALLSTYAQNNGKLIVRETAVPTDKNRITHLVFVRGQYGNPDTGAMTIDPHQFASFSVGIAGSGAEIIMSDTTIATGKTFLMGDTDETTFSISFNTQMNVKQS